MVVKRLKHILMNSSVHHLLRLKMEHQLGSLILATDISRQNEYLGKFRTHLDQDDLYLSNASHRHFILQVCAWVEPAILDLISWKLWGLTGYFVSNSLQMALKCADICNPCRPWELSKQWSEKVTEEFFHQGILSFFFSFCMIIILPLPFLISSSLFTYPVDF
jgi:hypothetical protein